MHVIPPGNAQSGYRRQAGLIALAGGAIVLAALLFGLTSMSRFHTANSAWEEHAEHATAIGDALAELSRQTGYGGFIHNFKNLVLRRDLPRYRDTIDANIAGFRQALDRLDGLLRAPGDRAALAEIRRTFEEYASKYLSVPAMMAAGASSDAIDALVKVDDGPALKALAYLNARADERVLETRQMARAAYADAVRFNWIGRLLLLFVVLAAAAVITRFLRHLLAANETIRKTQKTLDTLLDTAPDPMLSVAQNGRIVRANQMAEGLFGYPSGELIGMEIEQLIPERYRQAHRGHRQGFLADARFRPMSAKLDLVALTRDGREPDVEINLSASGAGTDWLATATIRDVTERKRLERAALEQFKLAEAFFNHSVSCLVVLDRNFNFRRVNEAYARACRLDIGAFAGRNHFEMYPSDTKEIFDEVVRTKKPFQTFERAFEFSDQPERGVTWWEWTLVPILDGEGEVEYLVFSLNEVTERKRAQEIVEQSMRQVQALSERVMTIQQEERDRLARELHDELGQTLTALKINLQLLEPDYVEGEAEAHLAEALTITARALEQVRNMALDLRPLGLEELGLAATLQSQLAKLAQTAGWDAHFEATMPIRLHPEVKMVCYRIVQEALTNIMRHARAKQVWVTLGVHAGELQLCVRDDGKGFDIATVSDPSTPGSLGLIGMRERARQLGGRLAIHSAPGRGTEVRASFPIGLASSGGADGNASTKA